MWLVFHVASPYARACALLQLHKDGKFPFDRLITYYDSLSDINQAVADVSAGSVIKPVLRIG